MDIIAKLEATKSRTLAYFDLSPVDLEKTYAPGKWTVAYILHHLADSETVLYDRIRRVISEPTQKQVLWVYDQDAWAAGLDYATVPIEMSKRIYAAVRDGVIHQARAHYERSGHLEFVHSATGLRTLRDEFDKVAAHNEQHLAQIEIALR